MKTRINRTLFTMVMLTFLIPELAAADDWRVSAFATLGASYVADDDLYFSIPSQRRTKRPQTDFGAITVAGLQLEHRLAPTTSAVVQLRSHDHSNQRFRPTVNRGFIRHEVSPNVTVRAGRLRTPSFMWSESLDLNFGQPWIRPPVEVYGINPLTEVDGVDLIVRTRIAGYDLEFQPYAGAGGFHRFPNGKARYSSHRGLTLSVEREGILVHLGHGRGKLSVHSKDPLSLQLEALFPGVFPPGVLNGRKADASFTSVGFKADVDRLQIMGEWASRSVERFVNSAQGWHLTAAYQIGNVTPYVTIARQQQTRSVISPGAPVNPVIALYERSRNPSQRSYTLGARWDAGRNQAIKLQWSRIQVPDDAWGNFLPRKDNRESAGRTFNMFSLSLDVVF